MILVVTDITRYGIVMVGDSAVTLMENDEIVDFLDDAAKVQYSEKANVGITMWGNGNVNEDSIDSWIADFIDTEIAQGDELDVIGQRLADQLKASFSNMGMSWEELRGGFHLAGYNNGLPRLWHIHTGPENQSQHELRLHRDFPENKNWSDSQFELFLSEDE